MTQLFVSYLTRHFQIYIRMLG